MRLHVWLDTTLQELTALVLTSLPPSIPTLPTSFPLSLTLSFSLIYPDKTGTLVLRPIGRTTGPLGGADAARSLQQCGLEVGDWLDVAVGSGLDGGEAEAKVGGGGSVGVGVVGEVGGKEGDG